MYELIFYFFYRYFLYRNDSSPRFGAICGTFLTIGLHIILAYTIVQKIIGHNLLNPLSETYYWNKILNMLVVLPFLFLGIMFFNKKRVDKIINKYDQKIKIFSLINWVIFISLTIAPFVLIIFLLKK
jgi:hypothetical protein